MRWMVVATLAGCGRVGFEPVGVGDAGTGADAVVTCMPQARPCGCWASPPGNFDPCMSCAPTTLSPLTLGLAGVYDYDTDLDVLTGPNAGTVAHASQVEAQPGGMPVRIVYASGLDVAGVASVRVHGGLPLIFAIEGEVSFDGAIGGIEGAPGPGAGDAATCTSGAGGDAEGNSGDIYGGSGGGGGGFGAVAGAGGDGWGVGAIGSGGTAGAVAGDGSISPLRGGCPGGRGRGGWQSTGNHLEADGGYGGGAIQISSCTMAQIGGTIDMGGRGGGGGGKNPEIFNSGGGGGGGGAGGAILIEANDLIIEASAALCANGGAGGEGGSETADGARGPASTCSATVGAIGPDTVPEGGNGGVGGYLGGGAGTGVVGGVMSGGGGGGGGAVGRIRLAGGASRTIDPAAVITPAIP